MRPQVDCTVGCCTHQHLRGKTNICSRGANLYQYVETSHPEINWENLLCCWPSLHPQYQQERGSKNVSNISSCRSFPTRGQGSIKNRQWASRTFFILYYLIWGKFLNSSPSNSSLNLIQLHCHPHIPSLCPSSDISKMYECIPITGSPSLPYTMLRRGIVHHQEEKEVSHCIVRRRRTPHVALQEAGEVDHILCYEKEEVLYTIVPCAGWCRKKWRRCHWYSLNIGEMMMRNKIVIIVLLLVQYIGKSTIV